MIMTTALKSYLVGSVEEEEEEDKEGKKLGARNSEEDSVDATCAAADNMLHRRTRVRG